MRYLTVILLFSTLLLTSCFKDEAKNAECDILSVWIEGDDYKDCFYQPETDMRQDNVLASNSQIVFNVKSLLSLPEIPLQFTLTPGATIEPANGSMQDFSNGPVTYKVTSEDGQWSRTYTVEFREAEMPKVEFDFENYEIVDGSMLFINYKYYSWFEYDRSGNKRSVWATGNQGFGMGNSNLSADEYPTVPFDNGHEGKCVRMRTLSAGPLAEALKKYMAAGNLFIGRFVPEKVLFEPLKATEFGRPIDRVPIRVTGYYKYTPGPVFTDMEMNKYPNRTDEASIYAVFYRNKDNEGNDVLLYGDDVLSSPFIVKKAEVATLPPTSEWTRFEMFFEGNEADDVILAAQGYSITLVFSSSKDGASFEGAIGSELLIDEVEMTFENTDND